MIPNFNTFTQADSVIVAQITYQSLFKLYPKLSGMTGTAKTEVKMLYSSDIAFEL